MTLILRHLLSLHIFIHCVVVQQATFAFIATTTRHHKLPVVTFNVPRQRRTTLLKNEEGEEEESKDTAELTEESIDSVKSMFEGAVQSVTGNKDYRFGDISKQALDELTGKDFSKGNATYEFGDITKNMVTKAGKAISGKEDYQFGDITKSTLKEMDETLQHWKDEQLNNLAIQGYNDFMSKFTPDQQRVLVVSVFRFAAIALLTWGFWSNFCTTVSITLSWTKTCWESSTPIALQSTQGMVQICKLLWANNNGTFLKTYSMMRIAFDPLFLLIQAAGTFFTVVKYESFVRRIEQKWTPEWIKVKTPLLSRALALLVAFACNTGISMIATIIGIGFGSLFGIVYK